MLLQLLGMFSALSLLDYFPLILKGQHKFALFTLQSLTLTTFTSIVYLNYYSIYFYCYLNYLLSVSRTVTITKARTVSIILLYSSIYSPL